jgi:DNA-binding MarR family transcriptional regulator
MADLMRHGIGDFGLTRARAEVVWWLDRHGPMTQRELADLLQVTPRNVTGLLDALQDGDFIARRPHPTDRRAVMVTLTDHGTQTAAVLRDNHHAFAVMLFDHLPPTDLAGFAATIASVLAQLPEATPPADPR